MSWTKVYFYGFPENGILFQVVECTSLPHFKSHMPIIVIVTDNFSQEYRNQSIYTKQQQWEKKYTDFKTVGRKYWRNES